MSTFASRDDDRILGARKRKSTVMGSKKAKVLNNKNLGKAKSQGRSVGQKMILNHNKRDYSTVATPEHDRQQMRKHRITL